MPCAEELRRYSLVMIPNALKRAIARHVPQLRALIAERDQLRQTNVELSTRLAAAEREWSSRAAQMAAQMDQTNVELSTRVAAAEREWNSRAAQMDQTNVELSTRLAAAEREWNARAAQMAHEIGMRNDKIRFWRYFATRYEWQMRALQRERFGPPEKPPPAPRDIPSHLVPGYAMNGAVEIQDGPYFDRTVPSNYPLIYTDEEIDFYMSTIAQNLQRPEHERDEYWFIYGTLDQWICDAIEKYPIRGKSVVNMGSMTPWYEAMFIFFGAHPVTIDYNPIIVKSTRMSFMGIAEWERDRPQFDIGFSISSFEHDGLGMFGDPLDTEGDLKAMRKMKEQIKPGGILFLVVPTGRDLVRWNLCRVYGRKRLPMLMEGWEWIDSFGFDDSAFNGIGERQPLYVLRNAQK